MRTLQASQFGTIGDGSADDTKALQKALDEAFRGTPAILVIPPGSYRVTGTLRIQMEASGAGQRGILAHGAHIQSTIDDGRNILEIIADAPAGFMVLDGLDIVGTGRDGHGIYIAADGNGAALHDFCLRDIVIQNSGGDGIHLVGNLSEGQLINSYFRNNHRNGATFSNGRGTAGLSAVHVFGCVFGDNREVGAALINRCSDVAFHGCYFLDSGSFGLTADDGCTLLSNCGFENNYMSAARFADGDAGIRLNKFGTLVACMGYSIRRQTHLIRGQLAGSLVMVGCSGYGSADAERAGLARLGGTGTATASLIGCSGSVESENGFEALEIAGPGGGIKFGSAWQSRILPRLGDYRLWVDRGGHLRLKRGIPTSDQDGSVVGS